MTGFGAPAFPSADDATLQSYEHAAADYRRSRRNQTSPQVLALMDQVTALVGPGARCLEIGSGPGIDAAALEERGLRVTRTDAAVAFVDMMRADGFDARRLDVRTDELGGPWPAVWADAVLLHLDRAEFAEVVRRIRAAAAPDAVFALTLKEGDGEEWHSRKLGLPRYFTYWREPDLRAELHSAGWQVLVLDHVPGDPDDWLHVVARPS